MATTKLIPTHNAPNLDHTSEVVEVKANYTRSCLVPHGFAAKWTAGAQRQTNRTVTARRYYEITTVDDARAVRDALQGVVVEISGKVDNSDYLFGTIFIAATTDAIKKQLGRAIDRRRTIIASPTKAVDDYTVIASLHTEVPANLKVCVSTAK